MKLGALCVAYHEERFLPKYIQAMRDRVDEIVVLNSLTPWQGEPDEEIDRSADIARDLGATVIPYHWPNEQDQRNAGLDYLSDCDWVVVLDPDEFMLDADWARLLAFLETAPLPAYVCQQQFTYWKRGLVIDPPEDYKQIIAVRPGSVRFVDKRVVSSPWSYAPVTLHHFSWARTDQECLRKITHYAHAHELDPTWYERVWLSNQTENLHPLTPASLKQAVPVMLPEELERLNLWPSS